MFGFEEGGVDGGEGEQSEILECARQAPRARGGWFKRVQGGGWCEVRPGVYCGGQGKQRQGRGRAHGDTRVSARAGRGTFGGRARVTRVYGLGPGSAQENRGKAEAEPTEILE